MKRFYFLITFVLVNISADDEMTYKQVTFLTNTIIERAYHKNDLIVGDNSRANGLERVIENMINNDLHYDDFGKINFLIAVPDKMDIVFSNVPRIEVFDPVLIYTHYQGMMLHEMLTTLKIKMPDAAVSQENFRNTAVLDLTTLGDQRRRLVKPALQNIFKSVLGSLYYQLLVKLERRDKLGLNLTTLVEERRVTGTSLENIIRRRVFDGPVRDVSIFMLCRLIGIYMSTQFPSSYIKEVSINYDDNTCTLDNGVTQKRFKKINDEWWEISPDNRTVLLLEEQLG